jgi:hypothetical protein
MSNKKEQLLNESTVRRFMGLAGIGALSNKFVGEKQLNEEAATPEVPMEEQLEDEGPPVPGEMAAGPEDELPVDAEPPLPDEGLGEEEPVEDVDLSQEEAEVLIGLGRKLEAEMGDEEEGLPPGEEEPGLAPEMGPPPEEEEFGGPPAPGEMAENLIKTLTTRVANRVKKEYVVNEVMKRVAKRLSPRKKK